MHIAVLSIFLSLAIPQPKAVELKIVDGNNKPIEGVYVKLNRKFWHSNKDGIVTLKEGITNNLDSISFSHLSYYPVSYQLKELSESGLYPMVQLEEESKELNEVMIPIFDPAKYVEEAIKKISENYVDNKDSYLNLDADITFDRIDEDATEELINYKGLLQLSSVGKEQYVAKIPEVDEVSPNLRQSVFFLKPHQSLSITSIKYHKAIRFRKSYKYTSYEHLKYKDRDAIRICFQRKSDDQDTGSLIIDTDTQAILYLGNVIGPVKTWILGTMSGKGIVKTGINNYEVEADYIQDKSGKFIFDSGRESINSYSTWKKNKVTTLSNFYLKRNTDDIDMLKETKKLKEIF